MLSFVWWPDPLSIDLTYLLLILMFTKIMQIYIIKVFKFLTTWLSSGHGPLALSEWEIFSS